MLIPHAFKARQLGCWVQEMRGKQQKRHLFHRWVLQLFEIRVSTEVEISCLLFWLCNKNRANIDIIFIIRLANIYTNNLVVFYAHIRTEHGYYAAVQACSCARPEQTGARKRCVTGVKSAFSLVLFILTIYNWFFLASSFRAVGKMSYCSVARCLGRCQSGRLLCESVLIL